MNVSNNAGNAQLAASSITTSGQEFQPGNLRPAHDVIDYFLSLRGVLRTFHEAGDVGPTRAELGELRSRLARPDYRISPVWREIADRIDLKLAAREDALAFDMFQRITGDWRVRKQSGLAGLRKGDEVAITPARELINTRRSGPASGQVTKQTIQLRAERLLVDSTDLEFTIELDGDKLELCDVFEGDSLKLERMR